MFLVSSCSGLCPIHWSQVLSWEWRCSWSSADRRCSNYIWVINNFIAYQGVTYIRGFTVLYCGNSLKDNLSKWSLIRGGLSRQYYNEETLWKDNLSEWSLIGGGLSQEVDKLDLLRPWWWCHQSQAIFVSGWELHGLYEGVVICTVTFFCREWETRENLSKTYQLHSCTAIVFINQLPLWETTSLLRPFREVVFQRGSKVLREETMMLYKDSSLL